MESTLKAVKYYKNVAIFITIPDFFYFKVFKWTTALWKPSHGPREADTTTLRHIPRGKSVLMASTICNRLKFYPRNINTSGILLPLLPKTNEYAVSTSNPGQ